MTGPFLLSISVSIFSFFISLFCLVPCGRLSWLFASFWAHVNILHRIVSYHIKRWCSDAFEARLGTAVYYEFTVECAGKRLFKIREHPGEVRGKLTLSYPFTRHSRLDNGLCHVWYSWFTIQR